MSNKAVECVCMFLFLTDFYRNASKTNLVLKMKFELHYVKCLQFCQAQARFIHEFTEENEKKKIWNNVIIVSKGKVNI